MPFSAELTFLSSPKTLFCSHGWRTNFRPSLGYHLAEGLRGPAAASSLNFGWSVRPELQVFLLKQLVKVSSYPGYDQVALELFWKLLVWLYLGKDHLKASLGAFALMGAVKPVSPGPATDSHHRLVCLFVCFFSTREVLPGAYLSVQICSKALRCGTFCTCWPVFSAWGRVAMELSLPNSSSPISALLSWFALVGWNRAFTFPSLCFWHWWGCVVGHRRLGVKYVTAFLAFFTSFWHPTSVERLLPSF